MSLFRRTRLHLKTGRTEGHFGDKPIVYYCLAPFPNGGYVRIWAVTRGGYPDNLTESELKQVKCIWEFDPSLLTLRPGHHCLEIDFNSGS